MQCPKCGQPVEQDFGVFPCAKCHTVLFVDMEGQVQLSEEVGQVSPSGSEAGDIVSEAAPAEIAAVSPQSSPMSVVPLINVAPVINDGSMQNEDAVPGQVPLPSLREEMTDFANSEGAPGNLSYIIKIDQIDTSELRNRVYDALADRKFRWDAKALVSKITKGSLLLHNISAAKAIALISRLQELPVKVSWQQKNL